MNDLGDFSDLTDSAFEQERKKALAVTAPLAVSVASTKSPDAAAKAQALARRYNLPPLVVDHFAEDYAARAKQEDAEALMRKAPKLGSWIAEKPERADIVHDDLEGLAGIEQTIGKIGPMRGPAPSLSSVAKGIYESFGQGLSMAREGVRMQGADLLGFKVMGKDAARRFSQTQFEADTTTPEFEGATASGLYGGLTSTVRAVPSVAAAIAMRNPAVALGLMGAQTEAEAYGKYRTRGATPGMAAVGAIGEGAVEVATEMLPMGFLVEKFGKVGAKDFLKGLLGRELPTEQVATLLQDAIDTAVANPDKTWGEYLAERPEAAYKTLLATVVQSSVMGAANSAARRLGGQREQADEAEQFASQAEQLAGLLAASKTASRDATTLREFIAQVADEEGDAPTQFYVDGEQLLNVLNQSGMSRDEFAALAPTAAAQLDEALTGGVVRLPVAEFAAAGEKITTPLIDHLRASEDAPTRAEAREFMAGEGKALQEEVERELQKRGDDATFRDSVAGIQTRFEAELNAVGKFAPEVNKGYATLLSNFFGATAARLGMAPDELLAKYELRVQAKASDGRNVMQQLPTDEWAQIEAESAEMDKRAAALAEGADAIGFTHSDGKRTALASRDASKPGGWRITRLDDGKPYSHGERESLKDAIQTALEEGYTPDKVQRAKADQTDTPAFRRWFGDSKVVDAAGKPLVVYHGTARDFESFDPTKFGANTRATNDELGFFFTSKPFLSDNYAELAGKGGWNNAEPGSPVVYPVHLSIKNPKTYKTATEFYRDGDARAGNHGAWREDLIAQGYDGVVVRGDFEEVIVFDPKQAKSAIGNSGRFDPADPNILNQSAQEERKAKIIELRKRESILKSLQECMA